MLTEQKEKTITMLLLGNSQTDIAKSIGVDRHSIYDWLKNDEFNKEMELRLKDIAKSGNNLIAARVSTYIEQLHDLAVKCTDVRTKATVNMYLMDRVLGKTANRLEIEPIEQIKIPSRQELEDEFKMYKVVNQDDNM